MEIGCKWLLGIFMATTNEAGLKVMYILTIGVKSSIYIIGIFNPGINAGVGDQSFKKPKCNLYQSQGFPRIISSPK
jgi:hypothetical protein